MRLTRRKFLYQIRKKSRYGDHYGQCPKCKKAHEKGDMVFGRLSKRYCLDCYMSLFGKYGVKEFLTKSTHAKNTINHKTETIEVFSGSDHVSHDTKLIYEGNVYDL